MGTNSWSLVDVLKRSWSLTKENLIVVWGLLFLIGIVTFVIGLLGGSEWSARYWIFWAVEMLVAAWLNGALYKIFLNMTDEGEASFSTFKEMIPHIGKLFLLSIVSSIIIYTPFIVLALIQSLFVTYDWNALLVSTDIETIASLPSILFAGYWGGLWFFMTILMLYLAIRLLFALYILVDHPEEGVIAALRRSWQMTQGKVWKLLLTFLWVFAINFIGLCALVVGVFVSIVTTGFIFTVLYRQIDKEMNEAELVVHESTNLSGEL